jgi:hypothetical protein
MSTTPSPQPEKSSATQQAAQLKPLAIKVVGDDRVQVEFRIEDLLNRLIEGRPERMGSTLMACSGCGACSDES